MTPWFAFLVSLVYCNAADGEVDEEEVAYMLTALGGEETGESTIGMSRGNKAALDEAIDYAEEHDVDEFLARATPMLSLEQRLCILLNMTDSAMSDGEAGPEEQDLIIRFQSAFGISDELLGPYVQALIIKNDKSIFGR